MDSRRYSFFLMVAAAAMKCVPIAASIWATPLFELKLDLSESQVAIDDDGNIIEVLNSDYGLNHVVEAKTYRNAPNSWSDFIPLSTLDVDAHSLRLVVDPKGNAVAVWQISDGVQEKVQAAIYSSSANSWSKTKDLSEFDINLSISHVAMGESGNIFVAWKQSSDDYDIFSTVIYSQASHKWSKPTSKILQHCENEKPGMFVDPLKDAMLKNKLKSILY